MALQESETEKSNQRKLEMLQLIVWQEHQQQHHNHRYLHGGNQMMLQP